MSPVASIDGIRSNSFTPEGPAGKTQKRLAVSHFYSLGRKKDRTLFVQNEKIKSDRLFRRRLDADEQAQLLALRSYRYRIAQCGRPEQAARNCSA